MGYRAGTKMPSPQASQISAPIARYTGARIVNPTPRVEMSQTGRQRTGIVIATTAVIQGSNGSVGTIVARNTSQAESG
jgi:hypothetical protein